MTSSPKPDFPPLTQTKRRTSRAFIVGMDEPSNPSLTRLTMFGRPHVYDNQEDAEFYCRRKVQEHGKPFRVFKEVFCVTPAHVVVESQEEYFE